MNLAFVRLEIFIIKSFLRKEYVLFHKAKLFKWGFKRLMNNDLYIELTALYLPYFA